MLQIIVLFAKVIYRHINNRFINSKWNPVILGARAGFSRLPVSLGNSFLVPEICSKISFLLFPPNQQHFSVAFKIKYRLLENVIWLRSTLAVSFLTTLHYDVLLPANLYRALSSALNLCICFCPRRKFA